MFTKYTNLGVNDMARIAVDIDGVIAGKLKNGKYPEDYPKKKPLGGSVFSLKELKRQGHYIYLFTARFEEDREITEKWLKDNGFAGLYEELIMDKPQYDILIDDRAIRHDHWHGSLGMVNLLNSKGYHND
jgi:hypothetical protein